LVAVADAGSDQGRELRRRPRLCGLSLEQIVEMQRDQIGSRVRLGQRPSLEQVRQAVLRGPPGHRDIALTHPTSAVWGQRFP